MPVTSMIRPSQDIAFFTRECLEIESGKSLDTGKCFAMVLGALGRLLIACF